MRRGSPPVTETVTSCIPILPVQEIYATVRITTVTWVLVSANTHWGRIICCGEHRTFQDVNKCVKSQFWLTTQFWVHHFSARAQCLKCTILGSINIVLRRYRRSGSRAISTAVYSSLTCGKKKAGKENAYGFPRSSHSSKNRTRHLKSFIHDPRGFRLANPRRRHSAGT